MTFSLQENFEELAETNRFETDSTAVYKPKPKEEKIYLFAEKLRIPALDNYIPRPRLDNLIQSSLNKTGALLITGRAGSGKTALAVNFAQHYDRTVWYRVEAAESSWQIFASYLADGINKKLSRDPRESVAAVTETLFSRNGKDDLTSLELIVIDDIHNVFDAEWFEEFFTTALYSLAPVTHLIFLSRSKPGCPLWRLRSKQVLTVIDEKMLVFDRTEVTEFCQQRGISSKKSDKFHLDSFGRIGKLKTLIGVKSD